MGEMKLRIAICDDEQIIRNEIIRLCREFEKSHSMEFELVTFSSGDKLLNYDKRIDILFLDVQMPGLNGMETATKIREENESMFIIFVTGYRSFMQEGYKVKAFRYILKPIDEEEFMVTLGETIKEINKNFKVVAGKFGKTYYIKPEEIVYIEYVNRTSLVRTTTDFIESTKTMAEWEEILNVGAFYRVHRSYIVNMLYVEEIDKLIHMENGEKVQLAIKKAGKFKDAVLEFRRQNAI